MLIPCLPACFGIVSHDSTGDLRQRQEAMDQHAASGNPSAKRRTQVALFTLALAIRGLYLLVHPGHSYFRNTIYAADGLDYDRLAKSILAGGGYAMDGLPTSVVVPGYPFFLALIYAILGLNVVWVRVAQTVLGAATCLVIGRLAATAYGRRAEPWAALLAALYLPFVQTASYISSECFFTFILAMSLWCAVRQTDAGASLPGAAAAGLLTGLAVLTRPIAAVCVPAFSAGILLRGPGRAGRVGVFALAVLFVWTPWVVRNQVAFGRFIPLSTGGGISLYRSNNPTATGGSGGWTRQGIDTGPLPAADGRDEYEQDRYLRARAVQFARRNPGRYLRLCAKRLLNLWRPFYAGASTVNAWTMVISEWLILYPLAVVGLVYSCRRWKLVAVRWLLLAAVFLLYLGALTCTITVIRYRWPIMSIVVAMASLGVSGLLNRAKSCSRRPSALTP